MADWNVLTAAENNESFVYEAENDEQLSEEMYDCVTGVSHLLMTARLQAKEADIRARYAKQFADRSIAEAKSAHQVSEALSKTARVIASIALEFANKTDLTVNSENDTENVTPTKTDQDPNVSKSNETSPTDKFKAVFPSDLTPSKHDSCEEIAPKLETLWEMISANDSGDFLESETVSHKLVCGGGETDNTRRKIVQLYKDSKKMPNLQKSFETGDAHYGPNLAEKLTYSDMGVQTVTVTAGDSGEM